MKPLSPADPILVGSVVLLLIISCIMIGSASLSVSEVRYGNPFRIITHWLVYIPIGLVLMWGISRISQSWLKAAALPLLGGTLLMMVLVLAIGTNINGAKRWVSLFGLTLQPVEWLKPAVILYMAYYLSTFPERLRSFATGMAPMLVVLVTCMFLLLMQPDFGNTALLTFACVCLWFAGGVPLRHLFGLMGLVLPLGLLAILASPYRAKRLFSFTDPWADPFGSGYQLVQSIIAFGSGGLTGSGLGQGVQKLFYLPEAFTDFVVAVMAEELGLVGVLTLLAILGVLIWRGLRLAFMVQDTFARLLALGCTLLIAFTAMINMGAITGIIPTKGMPMPFISYGGSALFGNCILVGLLLAVQRHQADNRVSHRRNPTPSAREAHA